MTPKEISIFDIAEISLGKKFGLLNRMYFAVLADKLNHLGIKKSFSVLILIDKMGDHCSQKYIADTLHIDKTLLVGKLDHLEKFGFIKRIQNPSDRREYWIQLTDKGKKSIPVIQATITNLNEDILKGISQRDVTKFQKQLKTVYNNIQTISKSQNLA